MKIQKLHSWRVSLEEARGVQNRLKAKILLESPPELSHLSLVAAADVSFSRYGKVLYGAVVLMEFPALNVLQVHLHRQQAEFPYVPGFLSFREAPVVLKIFEKMQSTPHLLFCDGQGIAHPRGFGLASHLGVFLDIPTIGCAKSVLVGEFQEPAPEKGSSSPLIYQGQTVGAALRTRSGVKPVFVSPGHKISLSEAVKLTLQCSPRFRIPEPLRIAHQEVNRFRLRNHLDS
ncbi:MAG: deoxyribonuclease V [Calditrichia bacterium]